MQTAATIGKGEHIQAMAAMVDFGGLQPKTTEKVNLVCCCFTQ